ncbi:MAG: T9SS type A sorting domain-containing protein [bacterium]
MRNLRVRTLFLAGIVLALTMGLLSQPAQARFYIDIPGTDPCIADVPFTIEIYLNNTDANGISGSTNGFRIYSPTGATWQTPTYDTAGGLDQYFDGGVSLNGFSVDGSGADTIGLGGFCMYQPGIPNGYDDIVVKIETKMSADGDTLCIDSAFYPPGGTWLWTTPSGPVVPSWEGPYCWMVVPQISIAGTKFDDFNGNSVWEPGLSEQGLQGVTIKLHGNDDLGTVDKSTVTDALGEYSFTGLRPGDYWVLEEPESWWACQTFPLTVFHTIPGLLWGDQMTGYDFGNDTLCEEPTSFVTCLHGTEDNFVGPEAGHVSAGFATFLATGPVNYITDFDQPAMNQWFGHTFDNCWDDKCEVVNAWLRIKLKATGSVPSTDGLAFGDYSAGTNGRIWSISMSNLEALAGGTPPWSSGDVLEYTLDLANLPMVAWLPTNILGALQDGNLDIFIQDDTEVDFIELTVELCCDTCYADGDANNDGIVLAVADLVYLAQFITGPGPAPIPLYSCDLNGDGVVDIADLQLYYDYFIYGIGVFAPYGGYPVPCPCDPTAAPVVDTVHIYGLEHTSLGMACLEVVEDTLEVTRLGSSGDDGVAIDLRDMCHSWDALIKNPDFGDSLPEGASLSIVTTAVIDGTPDQVVNEMSQTKVGGNRELAVTTDAPSVTLEGYQGDSLVFHLEGYTGDVSRYHKFIVGVVYVGGPVPLDTIWGNDFHQEIKWYQIAGGNYGYVIVSYYTYNGKIVRWYINDQTILVDRINVIPELATPASVKPAFSEIVITTQDIPSLSFVAESYGVDAFPGIRVSNLGNAILTPIETSLVVSNIGPGGNDGICVSPFDKDDDIVDPPAPSLIEVAVENPNQGGTWPIGASLVAEFTFAASEPGGETFPMESFFDYAGSNTWNLDVESPASQYTVEAYRNDALVFSVDTVPVADLGYIVETARGVYPVEFKGSSTGKPASTCVWQAPDGVQWTWAAQGVSGLQIDSLTVTADTTEAGISSASILGTNGAKSDPISFTILSITAEPASCCLNRGDVDGSGATDVGDLTYLVAYLFQGGPEPPCPEEGDVDGSGAMDVGDLTYLVAYLFQSGPPPPDCGATPKMALGKVTRTDVSLSTTYDDDGATTITLQSVVDLRGLQIELRGAGNNRTVKLVDPTLEVYFHQDGGEARIGILDLEGATMINKGTSALVRLEGEYEITEAVASDLSHNTFSPVINSAAKTAELPHDFVLHQNYPNPFNPSTQINFSLPQASDVKLEVYNVLGQQVVTLLDDFREAGAHTVSWNSTDNSGKQVSSGVYFYRIQAADYTDTRKMLLLK